MEYVRDPERSYFEGGVTSPSGWPASEPWETKSDQGSGYSREPWENGRRSFD
jgi:hypothetical protein